MLHVLVGDMEPKLEPLIRGECAMCAVAHGCQHGCVDSMIGCALVDSQELVGLIVESLWRVKLELGRRGLDC